MDEICGNQFIVQNADHIDIVACNMFFSFFVFSKL